MIHLPAPSVLRVVVLVACLLVSPGLAAAQTPEATYAVRAGDRVIITLYTGAGDEVRPAGGERIIDRTGSVFLPLIGPTIIAGMDQTGIRDFVQQRYSEFFEDHVVQVKVELNVSITGAVRTPGRYFVAPTSTVIDAVNAAGGMASELTAAGLTNIPADQSRVRLVRDGVTTILNLRPDDVANSVLQMPIQSGDWIHVPNQSRSRVRDELQFWGGILGFVTNLAAIIILIGR